MVLAGLRSMKGVAAPPFSQGPYTWNQPVYFTAGVFGVSNGGKLYFVDSSKSSSGDGLSWDSPVITIAEAVALSLAAGGVYDTIYVKGNQVDETSDYAESVTVTAAQAGLRIIGVGNSPEGVMWTVGTAEGTILTGAAKDMYISGFRFRPNGSTSGVAIELAVTALGTIIENCIFRSTVETAKYGIHTESTADITIQNCVFSSLDTAIYGNAGVKTNYRNKIIGNLFDDKVDSAGIILSGRCCLIKDNYFTTDTTVLLSTYNGGAGEMNIVVGNVFPNAAYEGGALVGVSSDSWVGNFSPDTGNTDVGDNGITLAYPHQA